MNQLASAMRTLTVLAMLLVGCANVTSTKLTRKPDGTYIFNGGQNAALEGFAVQDHGATLSIKKLSETTSVDAINAEANREIGLVNAVADAVLKAVAAGAGAMKP